MLLALAQINPTVGDLDGNSALVSEFCVLARERGADLIVFPELCLSGYPPKDLLLSEGFVEAHEACAAALGAACSKGVTVVIGLPMRAAGARGGITNSLLTFRDGTLIARYDKRLLPTYDVFDENRYFVPGRAPVVFECAGMKVGLAICEDLWKGEDAGFAARYANDPDPVDELVNAGAEIIVAPSASPFVLGKSRRHRDILARHARKYGVHVVSVNQVGGNDDLVFDGHSCVFAPGEKTPMLVAGARGFEQDLLVCKIGTSVKSTAIADPALEADTEELLWKALVLGVRDYCRKTSFRTAILGVSGGIDSAITACIGAAALGNRNVTGVAMPGPYSSEHSKSDAYTLAQRLGMDCLTVPIARPMNGFREALDPVFASRSLMTLGQRLPDLTEENLQSRLRGTALMAISNRTGAIVLTTGNKSELAVGYCTLYGDMNGGLAVLSDVSKQQVYALSKWLNVNHAACGFKIAPIPESSITKPPSAELRPDQTDQDSLPPYDVLDAIIERYVEQRQAPKTIARETGFDAALVSKVARMIDLSEYKRKQAAVGIKVTTVAFGSGRRVPIAQRWKAP